jgi:cell division initiation protein
MRMTPLEIQSHRFGKRFGGYDRDEVETFLRMVTEDYEKLVLENESQRQRIRHLEERLKNVDAQEKLLQETLLNAQSISDKMREAADKECDVLLGAAEVRAEKILDASHRRAARLAENIRELRALRTSVAESLRGSIKTHLQLIDSLTSESDTTLVGGSMEGGVEGMLDGMVDGKISYISASSPARGGQSDEEDDEPSADARSRGGA